MGPYKILAYHDLAFWGCFGAILPLPVKSYKKTIKYEPTCFNLRFTNLLSLHQEQICFSFSTFGIVALLVNKNHEEWL